MHRVTNRWGYATASTPEGTLAVLEEKLPERHRVDINRLLVPFGKHICTGQLPRCSTCPVLDMCQQVGVTRASGDQPLGIRDGEHSRRNARRAGRKVT